MQSIADESHPGEALMPGNSFVDREEIGAPEAGAEAALGTNKMLKT
jgi:hypothetical protein